jgi:signal transduction histidine kinase
MPDAEVTAAPTPAEPTAEPATGPFLGAPPSVIRSADPTADREAADDARLIRRVRWRLVAWSGGSTLLVLLALGVALYLSVAQSLAASSVATLNARAGQIATSISGQPPSQGEGPADFSFGGATFGIIVTPSGSVFGPRQFGLPAGLPDTTAMTAAGAASDARDVRERTVAFPEPGGDGDAAHVRPVPVRQLTVALTTASGRYFVQIIQDRTTEAGTLENILIVLVVGSIIVVLVAVAFGAIYARRALVPIRDSLAGQRGALRRQREFAADASHELRTPLTVIRASVEHLRRHADEPVREVGDALEDIDAEVGHLTAMVGDLLLLARSDSGAVPMDRVPVELDDIAADAATALRGPAEARGVTLLVDPEPAPIAGDPARLRQLVTLLVDNAIRHSPVGGVVRVVARHSGETVHLTVEDQGPGIRPEDLPRVFDRFWRAADAPSGGTGLGLSIARWIAEQHDGRIEAANGTTGGARFDVELPARRSNLNPPAPPLPPPAASSADPA